MRVLQEITQINGRRHASRAINKAVDLIINTIDENFTLDGLCEAGVEPVIGSNEAMIIGNGSALVGNLKIICKTIYNIN